MIRSEGPATAERMAGTAGLKPATSGVTGQAF